LISLLVTRPSAKPTGDVDRGSSEADILKALAFCFKLVNTNAHDDPAAARRILKQLERMQ